MALKMTMRKREGVGGRKNKEYMVISLATVGSPSQRVPIVRSYVDEGTQTTCEPQLPPIPYGPPAVHELFTRNDPHFMTFVRENGISTLEQMLDAADVLNDLWQC